MVLIPHSLSMCDADTARRVARKACWPHARAGSATILASVLRSVPGFTAARSERLHEQQICPIADCAGEAPFAGGRAGIEQACGLFSEGSDEANSNFGAKLKGLCYVCRLAA